MKPVSEIDAIRQHAILASLAGFPFLLVFAIVWITAGALSYVVPREFAPWIYLMLGMPATPIALAIERRAGYVPAAALLAGAFIARATRARRGCRLGHIRHLRACKKTSET